MHRRILDKVPDIVYNLGVKNRHANLTKPHPLDVSILLVANAANHSVVVHGVHDVRLLSGTLKM
jgi:hypothetical protein